MDSVLIDIRGYTIHICQTPTARDQFNFEMSQPFVWKESLQKFLHI